MSWKAWRATTRWLSQLGYLPSVNALGSQCLLPGSFATFMEQKSEATGGPYRYLTSHELVCFETTECPGTYAVELVLSDLLLEGDGGPVLLQPNSQLFAAYQRSLSDEHQATLARWATSEFFAVDDVVSAAESPLKQNVRRMKLILINQCAHILTCFIDGTYPERSTRVRMRWRTRILQRAGRTRRRSALSD